MRKETTCTLLFLIRDKEILLAMKKKRFGKGKWNGVGGKVDPGETVEQAAVRETEEEIGVVPIEYEKIGEIVFNEQYDGVPERLTVHIFKCTKWENEPIESDEMSPKWFGVDKIPFDEMFADDRHWFPLFLSGKKFRGRCDFDDDWQITDIEINEIDGFA